MTTDPMKLIWRGSLGVWFANFGYRSHYQISRVNNDPAQFLIFRACNNDEIRLNKADTLIKAKAIAQADHDARILAAKDEEIARLRARVTDLELERDRYKQMAESSGERLARRPPTSLEAAGGANLANKSA